ncbi:hypothetical protein CWE08_11435 [Aliidiomarina iranensis]|uniref:Lipoprotein n=1 Tax=Aliidiomarina iranensis TaxID=1434071 RepID=A0A432VQP1_9GAMM|nr:hypothetical protein [Aliidiomarina iranensis]RUO18522.1 hypothetical protein CWE08_11435 [Aliidiomarina iranensis]
MLRNLCLISLVVLAASGCSTYSVNRYAVSVDNISSLKTMVNSKINVGDFNAAGESRTSITCRGVGPIKTPDGDSFESFIRKAFVDELKMAEAFDTDAPVTLTGTLDSIDFSSTSGSWDIAMTINSSNGESLSVSESYSFTSSFYGETACNQTAQALMPAVQNLIGKIVRDENFPELVKGT